jgi:hypothetical protein
MGEGIGTWGDRDVSIIVDRLRAVSGPGVSPNGRTDKRDVLIID